MDLYDELPWSGLLYDEEFSSLLDATRQYQISVVEFLTLDAKELARLLQRSINEVAKFQEYLLQEFDRQLLDVNKIELTKEENDPTAFTTTDVSIDEALGGGIFTRGITEIFGESSTGKSQFLMQLCLSVQLPPAMGGLGGKCVYITTEGDLPTQRLEEIISSRPDLRKYGVNQNNIYTVSCNDLINQEHILEVQLPVLLEKNEGAIKLIIIDSISHHMRVELQSRSFRDSQNNKFYIDQMAERLLNLANKHLLAVVVSNQVSDKPLIERSEPLRHEVVDYEYQLGWMVGWKNSTILFRQKYNEPSTGRKSDLNYQQDILSDDEDSILIDSELNRISNLNEIGTSRKGDPKRLPGPPASTKVPHKHPRICKKRAIDQRVPNLGLTWANHVSTRIVLDKTYKASPLVKRGELHLYRGTDPAAFWQVKRTMKVIFSTYAPPSQVSFAITKRGIENV